MFARCPACQTVFRVRPEQLRAHLGQVRCGHCYNPFNALEHLLEEPAPEPPASPAPSAVAAPPAPQPPAFADLGDAEPAGPPDRLDRFFVLEEKAEDSFSDQLDFEIPEPPIPPRRSVAGMAARVEPDARESRSPGLEAAAPDSPVQAGTGTFDDAAATDSHAVHAMPEAVEPSDMALRNEWIKAVTPAEPAAEVSPEPVIASPFGPNDDIRAEPFVIPAHARDDADHPEAGALHARPDLSHLDETYGPPPAPPARRWLSGLGIGILAGALAAQTVYLFRADIARNWPQLRPALVAACARLHCTVALPRIAGAISVEASDLQSDPGKAGRFVLNATIRNRAPHLQAYPHLELTLTDGQDRPLVRRVLSPQDWAPRTDIERGFVAGGDIVVALPFEARGIDATGYRIYVFYP
jgi:predicted Zn finger-like uncharacterized protein